MYYSYGLRIRDKLSYIFQTGCFFDAFKNGHPYINPSGMTVPAPTFLFLFLSSQYYQYFTLISVAISIYNVNLFKINNIFICSYIFIYYSYLYFI